MKDQIEFIEPQSMNFDAKISDACEEFLRREEKNKTQTKQGTESNAFRGIWTKYNGARHDCMDELDDGLYRMPKAQKGINKKLKDSRFMSKLQKECEHYVRENPDEFRRIEQPLKLRLDIVDNRILDAEGGKRKSKKEQLDSA